MPDGIHDGIYKTSAVKRETNSSLLKSDPLENSMRLLTVIFSPDFKLNSFPNFNETGHAAFPPALTSLQQGHVPAAPDQSAGAGRE